MASAAEPESAAVARQAKPQRVGASSGADVVNVALPSDSSSSRLATDPPSGSPASAFSLCTVCPELLFLRNPHWQLVDALPYVDPISGDVQADVVALVESEMTVIAQEAAAAGKDPAGSYLEPIPYPKTPHADDSHSILNRELRRLGTGTPMKMLNLEHYSSVDTPVSSSAASQPSLDDWRKALSHGQAVSEYAAQALVNQELMNKLGPNSWKRHINDLQAMLTPIRQELTKQKELLDLVNKRRKLEQVECGNDLRNLNLEREELDEKYQKRIQQEPTPEPGAIT
eukprot:GHVT01098062.1.p1 GENE.GHVT01098062.1~~GHVT01098062.1.p1  ORF type:complete len:285 (-),score=50.25 GHVT01098062.1:1383-2237(-)